MSLLDRKVRGFRLVDLVALGLLIVLILGVYLAKTMAGGERADIARAEAQIEMERERIRLLQAEVSHLEQPARIEHLSESYLGMGPVSIHREVTPEGLEAAVHNPILTKVSADPISAQAAWEKNNADKAAAPPSAAEKTQ